MNNVPVAYVWIYHKVKERNAGNFIQTAKLKEYILNTIRIPRCFVYDVIRDMQKFQLLKRENHKVYVILQNKCEKKVIKNFL